MKNFMEDYLKERIVQEFIDLMVLYDQVRFTYCRGISELFLTMCETDDENVMKFSLTNIGILNEEDRFFYTACVDGIISTYNSGRIIITDYDIHE